PFGEAPRDHLARASILTRLALTLIGPALIYGLVVVLLALGIHRGGEIREESTLINTMPSGPAEEAGGQGGGAGEGGGGGACRSPSSTTSGRRSRNAAALAST